MSNSLYCSWNIWLIIIHNNFLMFPCAESRTENLFIQRSFLMEIWEQLLGFDSQISETHTFVEHF